MRADNKGEGGSFALAGADLAQPRREDGGRAGLVVLGVLATALFYGDAMITPAISVLSAVEGLTIVNPAFEPLVLPISVVILIGLFLVQSRGTARVGRDLRPDRPRLFRGAGRARRGQHHRPSRNPRHRQPALGRSLLPPRSEARLPRHGLGLPRRDRRRDALCRHGPFRAQGDRHFLADARLSLPDAQLYGPGRAAARHSRRGRESVLPDGAGVGASAAGVHRHGGDDHRQPGRHLGRVLA